MLSRRLIIAAGGGTLASGLAGWRWYATAAEATIAIHRKSDAQGAHVTFDPVGLFIEPGTTVRWVCDANVHTTTAYHPKNRNRSLRIPIAAQPWDSGYLLPKQGFAVTLTVERVYDYFCIPHEHAGIGEATGPGAEPFDYFKGMPQGANWLTVPMPAQKNFPSIASILSENVVHPATAGADNEGPLSTAWARRMIKPDAYSPPRLPPALIARMPTVRPRPPRERGNATDRAATVGYCRRDEIKRSGVDHG